MHSHSLATTLRIVAVAILLAWTPLFLATDCGAQEAPGSLSAGFSGAVSQIQEENTLRQTGSSNRTSIENAYQNVTGIVTINQSSGSLNNQATAVLLSVSESAPAPNMLGIALMHNNTLEITDAFYSVSIGSQAFQGGHGLVAINQVSGNLNNQLTSVTLSVGRQAASNTPTNVGITTGNGAALVTLSNAQLTQIVASQNNAVTNNGSLTAEARLEEGAFQGFSGVAAATLTAGNLNQVMNHVAIQISVTP